MQKMQKKTPFWDRLLQRHRTYWDWDISQKSSGESSTYWDSDEAWIQDGEEWSRDWGTSHVQWYGTFLPRVSSFVPVDTILEIGPGHGRWTEYLRNYCSNIIAVDYSDNCIKACKIRFENCPNMSFFLNDGKSLGMVQDNTIDFIFSWESLAYADEEKILAYVSQFARKLTKNGVAFIHHSNTGEYLDHFKMLKRISSIPKLLGILTILGIIERHELYGKARTMSARKMQLYAEENGLQCISQEFFMMGTRRYFFDCISVIVKKESIWSRDNKIFRNKQWEEEAQRLTRLSKVYEFK